MKQTNLTDLLLSCFFLIPTGIHAQQPQQTDRVTIPVSPSQLEAAPAGPFEASWESLRRHYRVPEWFKDAKFGIFIHWGVYTVPAQGSEWYPRHMYNAMAKSHRERWGAQRVFGYKDFIPLFKAEKFDPQSWARLFREVGARYVIPTAEHHDGFAMYASRLTPWNAANMGPKRDIIGELGRAVRHEGLRFGISNHRVENWDFMWPSLPADSTDLFDPRSAGLYGPPQRPTDQSGMGPVPGKEGHHPQSDAFLNEWQLRVEEIIDNYAPDLIYFDNGVNYRSMDPWKLRIARYYYNSARKWGREVSIQAKSEAYLAGSIRDYERESRAPKQLQTDYWQVDDPIGHKFGYVEGLQLQTAEGIIGNLVDNISRNGNLCLNISPKADGTIPDDQQRVLRTIGQWLKTNGEGVYHTRAWRISGEGPHEEGHLSKTDVRFTCKGTRTVYAFVKHWDGRPFIIHALKAAEIESVTALDGGTKVKFGSAADGVLIKAEGHVAEGKMPNGPATAFRIRLKNGKRVLFIGDSITDGGWGRSGGSSKPSAERNQTDWNHLYGHSYMMLCAARYQSRYPAEDVQFFNRGISGNTLAQMADRWDEDAVDIWPDIVTVLIGTNDVTAQRSAHPGQPFDTAAWGRLYRSLLDRMRASNPDVRFVLCTPFTDGRATNEEEADVTSRRYMINQCAAEVKRIAAEYDAVCLPFNELFDRLKTQEPRPKYWIWDGIHPTPAGHERMAEMWLKALGRF